MIEGISPDIPIETCFILEILFFVFLVLIVVFFSRKIKAGELPPGDLNQQLQQVDYQIRSLRWDTSINYKKGKITITKDSIVATDIFFKQLPDGRIVIFHAPNAGILGWTLVIVLVFITGIGAVILAIIIHYLSRKFAKETIIPMIINYPPMQVQPPTKVEQIEELKEEYILLECPKCEKKLKIKTTKRPVTIRCPNCGAEGEVT